MTAMLARRTLLWGGLAGAVLPARSAKLDAELTTEWLLGSWRSDRERTMPLWDFQGRPLPPETRERVADLFGHMVWTVEPRCLIVRDTRTPGYREVLPYRVVGATSSSLSLRFVSQWPVNDATVFRQSQDLLFGRAGRQLEFFSRVRD